jgi:hypothetical protein
MANDNEVEGMPAGATVRSLRQTQASDQIEGLPEGATVRPLTSQTQGATKPEEVEGLPKGATLRPVSDGSKQSTSTEDQPSVAQVLIQPTEKTDKEYMGYRGPAGVAGATVHVLNRVAEETTGAVKGLWEMGKDIFQNPDRPLIIPDKEGKYAGQETIVQKYNPFKGLGRIAEVPGAVRDINASPDPLTHYANAAEDTAAQGAGQTLTALAAEKVGEKTAGAVSNKLIKEANATRPTPVHVELEARALESEKAAAKTQAEVDKYSASKTKGVNPPKDVVEANEKAQTKAAEDRFHADTAKETYYAARTAKPAPKIQPIAQAPEVSTEDVTAQPSTLKPLGSTAPARPINVKAPGEVAPEIIRQPAQSTAELPSQLGKIRLPEAEGVLIRPQPLLTEGKPPVGLAETLESTEKAVEPLIKEVKAAKSAPAKSTPVKPADLERGIREGLGGTELKPNVPLKEQVEKPVAEKPVVEPEKKLSSDPRKATLQRAGASDEDIATILQRGSKVDPTSKVGMSKLAEHFDLDLGDKAIGRGKGDIKAGTHVEPHKVLQQIIDAGHTPAEIAKAVREGRHLPTVSGGSQSAVEAPQPQGGHAGGSSASVEELNRPGKHYRVSNMGTVTYQGKSFAPEETPNRLRKNDGST